MTRRLSVVVSGIKPLTPTEKMIDAVDRIAAQGDVTSYAIIAFHLGSDPVVTVGQGTSGMPMKSLAAAAMVSLEAYAWPECEV